MANPVPGEYHLLTGGFSVISFKNQWQQLRWKDEPVEFAGWIVWHYTGQGPRWPCWECRGYFRKLYSNAAPEYINSTDTSYGISAPVQTNSPGQTQWCQFEHKWFCADCMKVIGVAW